MRVDARGRRRTVAEIFLNQSQVDAGFEQVGGPGMTKCMNRGKLVAAALFERRAKSILNAAFRHRLGCLRQVDMLATLGGKDERRITMRGPVVAQQPESALRQGNVTILVALAVTDMDHHPRTVDVGNGKADAFLQTQSAGIDRRETDAVAQQPDAIENDQVMRRGSYLRVALSSTLHWTEARAADFRWIGR
jgi:hypothetical protein